MHGLARFVASGLLVGVPIGGMGVASADGEVPPAAKPAGPGLAPGAYRIAEVVVEAMPTNRKGKPWDDAPGAEPDLVITIALDGEKLATCHPAKNAVVGRCKLDLPLALAADSVLELVVVDRDTVFDDAIGRASLADPGTWGVGMALPMVTTSRLAAARVVLVRQPTWWDVHQARLLGLGAGMLLALGVIGGFRSSLMPPPVPPRRCSHCHVKLGRAIATCPRCGAAQEEEEA